MAGNMDPNEIEGVAEAMEELRKGSNLSAESLTKLGGNSTAAYKALEGYSKALLGVTGSIGGMAKAVAQGEGSFSSLGSTIVGLTGVVGKLASAIPLVGGAAKALAEGVGEAAKFVLDQLDTMAKNYQTLGDASAGAADGVDGLLRQFNQMGNYSLPAFSKAVRANTLGLAAFQGTAAAGAEELSKVSGVLTTGQMAQRFLKLGMGLNAVGDATTEYLSTSARYGLTQGQTTEELTKKTQNYIEEVDKIARLTGQTREAQQKEAQKSLVDAKFRAKMADMAANGQGVQAEELRKYVEGLGGAAGDAARALVTGIPLTKEAAAANLFSNDAIRQNTLAVQGGKKAVDAVAETQQALADGSVRYNKQIQYSGDVFGGVAIQGMDALEIIKEQNKAENKGLTRQQVIDKMQEKLLKASGKNTEAFTKGQLAVADSSKSLQSLGFSLAEAAIPAVELFATTLDDATSWMNKKFGLGGTSYKARDKNHGAAGGPAGEVRDATARDAATTAGRQVVASDEARAKAENYYGKKMSDAEFSALIKATHAEAGAGKQASQEEQAMIMASVLNRARTNENGVLGALAAKNQFQSVTGTANNGHKPSKQYLEGPDKDRLKSIEGSTAILDKISKEQKNFTAASAAAYGPGTNIGYRDKMLAAGGQTIGGSVFQTGMPKGAAVVAAPTETKTVAKKPEVAAPTETKTAIVSGPIDRHRNDVAKVDPATTAGKSTQVHANQADDKKQTTNDSTALHKSFAEMVALQRQANNINKKILQRQT
jgi:hypothetical protein